MQTVNRISCTAFAVLLLVVVPAQAGPPLNGIYTSIGIGGPVLSGRSSESFAAAGGFLTVGNALNAASWNGIALGTQWSFSCPEIILPPVLLFDGVDVNGNGIRKYKKIYTGGTFVLDGSGPWGNGETAYTATIDLYVEVVAIEFVSFQRVGAAMVSLDVNGHFLGFSESCLSLSLAASLEAGNTDTGSKPASYPDFVEPGTCSPTRIFGSWWDQLGMGLKILGCTVPVEPATWGAIKSLYQ